MKGYFGGKATFGKNDGEYAAVLAALNIMVSNDTPLVIMGNVETDSAATVVFAFKCPEKQGVLSELEGCTLGDVKRLFSGCDFSVTRLDPNIANKEQLAIARDLDSVKRRGQLSMSDIKKSGGREGRSDPFGLLKGMQRQVSFARDVVAAVKEYGRGSVCLNMVLAGGPGTGKSSFAEAFGKLAMSEGIVSGRFCKVGAERLIADYAGQTAGLVKSAFDQAQGGILFIDEAYRLNETAAYGTEAVNALNQLMEESKDDVAVIVAGYKDRMDAFLESNPGLSGRFGFYIDFPAYDQRLLFDIFVESFAREKGMSVSQDATNLILSGIAKMSSSKGFAGARTVRKFFERCLVKQAAYCGGGDVLSRRSVEMVIDDADFLVEDRRKIGFF